MISGTLEIVRGTETLDISDVVHYALDEVDGFGMPPIARLSEKGPLQHGESDRGYRLGARLIQCVLTLRATGWAEYYSRRQELLGFLSPTNDSPISLRFTQPDGTVRQIDGYAAEGPSFSKRDAKLYQFHKVAFRLSCPDPAWYDPERKIVRVVGSSGGDGFAFPLAVPWTFGGTSVNTELSLDYDGTWLEYPEIVITGPISDPRIEHMETGDVLDFDGATIDNGDSYTIDLRYGYKTIVDGSGTTKIAELTPESDLATWRLQTGANTVAFSGVSAGANTSIVLRYYNRYLGV